MRCGSCGKVWELTTLGEMKAMEGETEFSHIPDWFLWERREVEKEILAKFGGPTARAMVESGLYHISLLEKYDFTDSVLSLKSSNVQTMYDAYVTASQMCDYPLHLGVTEAGTLHRGTIKSAAGIGGLLLRGVGDTIRVSLTDDPVNEVKAGIDLLKSVGKRAGGIKFVSCPTCKGGRSSAGGRE